MLSAISSWACCRTQLTIIYQLNRQFYFSTWRSDLTDRSAQFVVVACSFEYCMRAWVWLCVAVEMKWFIDLWQRRSPLFICARVASIELSYYPNLTQNSSDCKIVFRAHSVLGHSTVWCDCPVHGFRSALAAQFNVAFKAIEVFSIASVQKSLSRCDRISLAQVAQALRTFAIFQ